MKGRCLLRFLRDPLGPDPLAHRVDDFLELGFATQGVEIGFVDDLQVIVVGIPVDFHVPSQLPEGPIPVSGQGPVQGQLVGSQVG